jgi:copper oxidase (laccase) domain-containing protein
MSIEHALLHGCGVRHGFGTRGDAPPARLLRPRQVDGARVASARECAHGIDADAVVARGGADAVGVVTADCVPVLAASADGRAVAAIHAGWRGLAAGVIEAGIAALREQAPGAALRAVIGPHIGPCCYGIDEPVPRRTAPFRRGSRRGEHPEPAGASLPRPQRAVAQRAATRGRVR